MSNRILLVEDDQSFGAVLKDYLTINNFEVNLATDGEQGLKEFTENEFDICIFDVMMPKKDGFSLAEDVKKIDKNTPIIFLTARNMRKISLKDTNWEQTTILQNRLILNFFCIRSKPFCKEVLL